MSGRVYTYGSIPVQLHCIGVAIKQDHMFARMYLYRYSLGGTNFFHTTLFPTESTDIPIASMNSCCKHISFWQKYTRNCFMDKKSIHAAGWPAIPVYETT